VAQLILIAEDDPSMSVCLQHILESSGYNTLTADNGIDALKILREKHPAMLLTGLDLPDLGGFGLCQAIRDDHQCDGIKIMIVTSKTRSVDKDKAHALGADSYITKPFKNGDILKTVQHLSENKGAG